MHWVMDMFRTDCGNRPQTVGKQRFRSITKALGRGENIWLAQLVSAFELRIIKGYPKLLKLLSISPSSVLWLDDLHNF